MQKTSLDRIERGTAGSFSGRAGEASTGTRAHNAGRGTIS